MKKNSNLEKIRLNRYISKSGICSRRDADNLILSGKVKVNNTIIKTLGSKVNLHDSVKVNNKLINIDNQFYILLNKPKNYSTYYKASNNHKSVFDLVKVIQENGVVIGELDDDCSGLLLITNDKDLYKKYFISSDKIKNIYSVTLKDAISNDELINLKKIVLFDNQEFKFEKIHILEKQNELGIEVHGENSKIIKRVFNSYNHQVSSLDRVVFGNLTKKDLPRGKWRKLKENEIRNFKSSLKN